MDDLHKGSLTIDDFCRFEQFSKWYYHKLKNAGLAPREIVLPGRGDIRISPEAHRDWHAMMENPSPELAEQLRNLNIRKRAQSRKAAAAAVASPRHISNRRRGTQADAVVLPKRKRGA